MSDVNALAFNGDGTRLATPGLDRTAQVRDMAEAIRRQRVKEGNQAVAMGPCCFEGNAQSLYAVVLSADGSGL